MNNPMRFLYLEDNPRDAELVRDRLRQNAISCDLQIVSDRAQYEAALTKTQFDLILSDFRLPDYDGVAALLHAHTVQPEVPFILVSGALGEEQAVDCMLQGATDFVLKQRLERLAPAVRRALTAAEERQKRLAAEAALRDSMELRVQAERIGRVGGWEFNIDTKRQKWTEIVYQIHEVEPNYEPTVADGVNFYTPESRPIIEQAVQRAIEHGEAFDLELQIITAKGNRRTVHVIGSADLSRRKVNGFFQDITARRKTDAELRDRQAELAAIFEHSPVMMCLLDQSGNVRRTNLALAKFVGRSVTEGTDERVGGFLRCGRAAASPTGCGSSEQCPAGPLQDLIRRTVESGREHRQEEIRSTLIRAGEEKEMILTCSTACLEVESQPMVLLCMEDVTDKKLMEAKLLRAQRVESIGSLASGIAHDLNNILTPIVMCAPMLKDDECLMSRRQVADTIESCGRRAVTVVKQLLSFARGREGQKVSLHARHLVREMAMIARETFPRNIRVEDDCAADLWPVMADATQLHQVILNLCVNARDAMPHGGTLTIRASNVVLDDCYVSMHQEAVPGPFVRLQVEDTGTGIPDALRSRIFESFFTTKGEDRGTGLGLTTVQGIVRDHKGFIMFTSAPGKGTTFEVHLPALREAQFVAATVVAAEAIPDGHGELVLVVDDEPAICEATKRILERHGYAVMQAHDGIEALAEFSVCQAKIRAVVSDFMMPLMDGVTLFRTLHRLSPNTVLIASSGGLFGPEGEEALEAYRRMGVRHILQKPHNADVLLRTLADVFSASQPAADGKGRA